MSNNPVLQDWVSTKEIIKDEASDQLDTLEFSEKVNATDASKTTDTSNSQKC